MNEANTPTDKKEKKNSVIPVMIISVLVGYLLGQAFPVRGRVSVSDIF